MEEHLNELQQQATQKLHAGDFEGAIAICDKILSINPNVVMTQSEQGKIFSELKHCEETLKSNKLALKIDCQETKNRFYHGGALISLQGDREALNICQQALTMIIYRHYVIAWSNRGRILWNLKRYDEALESYEKALGIDRDYTDAWFGKGATLNELKRYEEAIVACDEAIAIDPNYASPWSNRGSALNELKRYEEGILACDKATAIDPNFASPWNNRGCALFGLKCYEEAIVACDEAIAIDPNFASPWNTRGSALNELKRYEEAIVACDEAIAIDPNYASPWSNRGSALIWLKRYSEALKSCDKAIAIDPNHATAWSNRGCALNELKRYEEAIVACDEAIAIDPNYASPWNTRGSALNELKRYEEAIESCDKAIAIDPNYASPWSNRGSALNELKRYEEGILACDKAIAIDPNFASPWNNRGCALFGLKRYEEALKSYDKAIEIEPDYAQAWSNKIQVLFWTKGYEKAQASFREALNYIKEENNPQGWAELHEAIGEIHYLQGRKQVFSSLSQARAYFKRAKTAYQTALKTLKHLNDTEAQLEVLRKLIKVLSELGESESADNLIRQGSELLHSLLSEPELFDRQKQRLALQFASFNQLFVDLLVKENKLTEALLTAERDKNACLSWFFDRDWIEASSKSPELSQFQELLTPNTAMIYWHISPVVVTTFIIKHGDSKPSVLPQVTGTKHKFEDWCKTWRQDYQNYCQASSKERSALSWRTHMTSRLEDLKPILNISGIQELTAGVSQLILIPHQDLHLLPLELLFPDVRTVRLPSVKAGQPQPQPQANSQADSGATYDFLSLQGNAPDLLLASLGTDSLSNLYSSPNQVKLDKDSYSLDRIKTELQQARLILHILTHGKHDFSRPSQSALFFDEECKLTASDIYHNLGDSLKQILYVTLLACELGSATSETITTEYVGISSVLLSCGVRTVISPLWRIEENFATLMMIELHKALKNESPYEALANAKDELRMLTWEKYWSTPVYREFFRNSLRQDLKPIEELAKSYSEESPTEFESFLLQLQEQLKQLDTVEVEYGIESLKTSLIQMHEMACRCRNRPGLEQQWKNLRNKLSDMLDNLSGELRFRESQDPNDKPFDHPYYLAAFICQGLS
jgi:tetratricopeptide (TPR) repeat protein